MANFVDMSRIKCFVFSWKGQYENAVKLENQLKDLVDVVVINSDDDNNPEHWVNIGNECYFSDQFRKALELFDENEFDTFWHIQADASYDNFQEVLESAKVAKNDFGWGIFAPNIDYTWYDSSRVNVAELSDRYKLVANVDNTCWFIDSSVISSMKKNLDLLKDNKFGWGFDLLACGLAILNKQNVIRDYGITIHHPESSNYDHSEPEREMQEFYKKCPAQLQQVIYYIKMEHKKLASYFGIEVKKAPEEDMFVFDTQQVLR